MLKKSELTANMLLNVYIFISNKEQSGCVDLLIVCRKIRQYSDRGKRMQILREMAFVVRRFVPRILHLLRGKRGIVRDEKS